MEVERYEINGQARYRIHSDYDGESVAVTPKELTALLTWLQEHESEVIQDSLKNQTGEAIREIGQVDELNRRQVDYTTSTKQFRNRREKRDTRHLLYLGL